VDGDRQRAGGEVGSSKDDIPIRESDVLKSRLGRAAGRLDVEVRRDGNGLISSSAFGESVEQ
jgi:hypothetical protein